MAPFTHVSPDRPSRFTDGSYGVLYVGNASRRRCSKRYITMPGSWPPAEAPGWTSQFREIVLDVTADLHDLRGPDTALAAALDPDDYAAGQSLGRAVRRAGTDGLVYPSVRYPEGTCAGLFYPDLGANVRQGRHLDYHWNGKHVDFYRDAGNHRVFAIT